MRMRRMRVPVAVAAFLILSFMCPQASLNRGALRDALLCIGRLAWLPSDEVVYLPERSCYGLTERRYRNALTGRLGFCLVHARIAIKILHRASSVHV